MNTVVPQELKDGAWKKSVIRGAKGHPYKNHDIWRKPSGDEVLWCFSPSKGVLVNRAELTAFRRRQNARCVVVYSRASRAFAELTLDEFPEHWPTVTLPSGDACWKLYPDRLPGQNLKPRTSGPLPAGMEDLP